jgi:hypothetical protein
MGEADLCVTSYRSGAEGAAYIQWMVGVWETVESERTI